MFPTLDPTTVAQTDTTLDYQLIGWPGRCEVHEKFTVQDIADAAHDVAVTLELAEQQSGCGHAVLRAVDEPQPRMEVRNLGDAEESAEVGHLEGDAMAGQGVVDQQHVLVLPEQHGDVTMREPVLGRSYR